jgi:hypothetical protein
MDKDAMSRISREFQEFKKANCKFCISFTDSFGDFAIHHHTNTGQVLTVNDESAVIRFADVQRKLRYQEPPYSAWWGQLDKEAAGLITIRFREQRREVKISLSGVFEREIRFDRIAWLTSQQRHTKGQPYFAIEAEPYRTKMDGYQEP